MNIHIGGRDCWRKLTESKLIREEHKSADYDLREFKRDIEMNTILFLKAKLTNDIKRTEAELIYFNYLYFYEFNITFLTKFFIPEEVIIVYSHPKPFRYNNSLLNESISNILPAISCLYINLNLKPSRIQKKNKKDNY